MESPNTLTIRASNRTVVFSMEDHGDIWFRKNWRPNVDQVVINLAADDVISGGREYESVPSITLSWLESPFDFDLLVGREIHIPFSYDDARQDHVTDFYHDEHLDFDDVRIKFVEREGDRLRIQVTGKVTDLYADGSAMMDIECDTLIEQIDASDRC